MRCDERHASLAVILVLFSTPGFACKEDESLADGGAGDVIADASLPDAAAMDAADPCADASCPGLGVCSRDAGGACVLPQPGKVGEPCASGIECDPGEQCFTEDGQGFVGGYCSNVPCTEFAPCPENAVCTNGPGAPQAHCLRRCAADVDCRDRYVCDPAPLPDGPKACVPACRSDLGCALDGTMTCSSTTSRCIDNLMHVATASVGDACAGSAACAERQACIQVWPDGYCTTLCESAPCPRGATCVDTRLGPLCFKTCGQRSDCRAKTYACDVVTQNGTQACIPSCTVDPCPDGFTCNTTTGICQ
jgi:hypothetical protein